MANVPLNEPSADCSPWAPGGRALRNVLNVITGHLRTWELVTSESLIQCHHSVPGRGLLLQRWCKMRVRLSALLRSNFGGMLR